MPSATELLREAAQALMDAGVDTPRLDAELLLAAVLGRTRRALWTYPDTPVPPEAEATFRALLARRCRREPLAYLLGTWEFYGRTFTVTPDVLIPRPETELLVEAVLDWARAHPARLIADIGTGSGAIAVTLAAEAPDCLLAAVDLSPAVLAVAQENAARHGVGARIRWFAGDLLAPVRAAGLCCDAIVANLPYIAHASFPSLMPEVRAYEPSAALFAGEGGLALIRRLIHEAPACLRPGGLLALEVGYDQADAVCALLQPPWQAVRVISDYGGIPRHVLAEYEVS